MVAPRSGGFKWGGVGFTAVSAMNLRNAPLNALTLPVPSLEGGGTTVLQRQGQGLEITLARTWTLGVTLVQRVWPFPDTSKGFGWAKTTPKDQKVRKIGLLLSLPSCWTTLLSQAMCLCCPLPATGNDHLRPFFLYGQKKALFGTCILARFQKF